LFRHWVDYISERKAKLEFLKAKRERRPVPQLAAISLDELRACQADAQALPVDDAVDSILADLQETLATTGVDVSDRRLGQCLDVMRAHAWLCGDPEVGPEHVDVLEHVLWRRPEDIPAVQAAIGAVDKGVLGHLRSATEEALREYYALRADCDAAGNWRSEESREKYKARCLDLMNHIQAKAAELFAQYNRKLPARIKERAQAYFTELNLAFEQCRNDARL
jgi:hypothetical protein